MAEVSIIINASEGGVHLEKTIQSCLDQSFSGIEVLVVGSEKSLVHASQKFQTEQPSSRIQFLTLEHVNIGACFNFGIDHSSGEFIQFLNSGDLLHRNKIEVQKKLLENDAALDMCFCLGEMYANSPGDLNILWNTPELPFHLDRFLWNDPVWSIGSPLWKKTFLDRIGSWNEKLSFRPELEFHIRAICSKLKYFHTPFVLYFVQQNSPENIPDPSSSLSEREESKRKTLTEIYNLLTLRALLNTERADAIAAHLMLSAQNLFDAGLKEQAGQFLNHSQNYARGGFMKMASRWMHGNSFFLCRWTLGAFFHRAILKRQKAKQGFLKRCKKQDQHTLSRPDFILPVYGELSIDPQKQPFASIIIPTFKRAQSLELTLKDLCAQSASKDEFEVLVVDNGCSDEARKVVDRVNSASKILIKYILEQQPGAHHARHTGARLAKGEVLIFLDDDMRIGPDWLSSYIREFRNHPGMAAAGGRIQGNWEKQPELWIKELIGDETFFPPFGLLSRGDEFLLSPDGYFFSGNMAITKNALFNVGGFNPDQLNDVVLGDGETGLHKKLWSRGFHVGYVPGALSHHYIPESKMNLDFLLRWSKNWGISSAYGEYSKKTLTTPSLFIDVVKRLIHLFPYRLMILLRSRRKLDAESIHRQMFAVCLSERMRFVWRLILSKNYRKFVQHQDWLNRSLDARLHG